MKPKKFQEANVVYGEGQPEYKPLPAHKTKEGQAISFYDKTSGEAYGFNSDLSRLTALKGRITLQENRIKDYIEANKDNLFFDETNDPQLVKVRKKLERARKNVANAEARLRTKVEQKIAGK